MKYTIVKLKLITFLLLTAVLGVYSASAQSSTVTLTPAAPVFLWAGANTTNVFNVGMNIRETNPAVLLVTNIQMTINGTNATTIFGRYTGANIDPVTGFYTNNTAAGVLTISVTNAVAGFDPLTTTANGDGGATYTTNLSLFVVPQWTQTNSGASFIWDNTANWSGGVIPTSADHVLFNHAIPGPWTNIMNSSRSIQSLIYLGDAGDGAVAAAVNTTLAGTLSVVGTNGFFVGRRVNTGVSPFYTFFGDTLVVSNPAANFTISDASANSTKFLTVNMFGLTNLLVNVRRFSVADISGITNNSSSPDGAEQVNFTLAQTNDITATYTDNYANVDFNAAIQYERQDQSANAGQITSGGFFLGQYNNIKADSIAIGNTGANGSGSGAFGIFGFQLRFNTTFLNSLFPTNYAIFRNTNGGRMSLVAMGITAGTLNQGVNNRGIMNLVGGNVDMLVDQMWVGRNGTNNAGKDNLGGFYFDNGVVNANVVMLGNYQFTNVCPSTAGYLMIGGGTNAVMAVNNYISLGHIPSDVTGFETFAAAAQGQIQIKANGTLDVNTIICGTNSAANNQVIVNGGGNLVLTNTIGDSTNKLSILNVNKSQLTFHLDGSATTTNIFTKSIVFAGSPNVINIGAIKNLTTFPTRFTLISYDSTLTAPAFTKGSVPVGFNGTVNNTGTGAGTVYIDISTNLPKTLVWRGYLNGNWDHSTTNWWDPVALTSTNTFNDGDFVIFDDTAVANTTISVTENIAPGQAVGLPGMAVTNTTFSYVFNSGGGTIGLSSLIKSGANTLTINVPTTLSAEVVQGTLQGSGNIGGIIVDTGAVLSYAGVINGAVACFGIVTNGNTINGTLTVGNSASAYNLGTLNGSLSVADNAFLYNQGNLNVGGTPSTGTNSVFFNSGNITGGGLTIGGTYQDTGSGTMLFTNVTTINGNAVFLPGNADGSSRLEIDGSGPGTFTQRGRVLLSNNSTNIFGVNADNGGANDLASFSVDFGNNNTLSGGGGVIVITNVGVNPLAAGQSYRLFENENDSSFPLYEAGTNTAAVIRPPAPGPGLAWDTRTLRQDGRIKIISVGTSAQLGLNFSITNNLVLFTGFTTNTTTSVVTTNYSTNKAAILNLSWPSTNVGWRLQQQISSASQGIRAGDSNWTFVYPSWWTNGISVTNNFSGSAADFYRLVYP